jgi:hypothetical protein
LIPEAERRGTGSVGITESEVDRQFRRRADHLQRLGQGLATSAASGEQLLRVMAEALAQAADTLLKEAAGDHDEWRLEDRLVSGDRSGGPSGGGGS